MKIGHHHHGPEPSTAPAAVGPVNSGAGEAAAAPGQAEAQAAGPAATGSATVKLSATASSLLAGGSAEFDAAKVEKMRQAIASGSFQIDPGAIADKLIANAQELLGKSSH